MTTAQRFYAKNNLFLGGNIKGPGGSGPGKRYKSVENPQIPESNRYTRIEIEALGRAGTSAGHLETGGKSVQELLRKGNLDFGSEDHRRPLSVL